MKRASLRDSKVPRGASQKRDSADVTDRLLGDKSPAQAKGSPKARPKTEAAASPVRPARRKSMSKPDDEPLPYVPYRPVPDRPPAGPPGPAPAPPQVPDLPPEAGGPLSDAVKATRAAVEALQAAAVAPPAQYDLAIRYRLHALAHHLEQVAGFVARQVRS